MDHIRKGYRRSVLRSESTYFRIDGETVEVMAIVGQQNLDEWLQVRFKPVGSPGGGPLGGDGRGLSGHSIPGMIH